MDPRDPQNTRHFQFRIEGKAGRQGGPIAKFVAFTLGVAALVAGFFLSIFVFIGLIGVGLVGGGWLWWRTRGLRRQLKDTLRTAEERIAAARAEAERRQTAGGSTDSYGQTMSGASPGETGAGSTARAGRGAGSPGGTIIDGDYIREKGERPSQ